VASHGAYGPPGAELQRLYDADAVDHYITQLQGHIAELQHQLADAVALAEEAQAKAVAVGRTEALLGRALLSAQQAADQAVTDAQRKAELIVAEARREADQLLADVRVDAQRIVDEAHQTVEAVFATLHAQREAQAAPEPEPAPAVFPPPVAPPPAVWAAPDPATREPDEGEDNGTWGPAPVTAWEEPVDGTIVDLRPGRAAPATTTRGDRHEPPPGGADWALALGGTGTEGLPARAAEPVETPRLVVDPSPRADGGPVSRTDPGPRPAAADLLDRWRLARGGTASADDEFVSRRGQLDSLADGSYVSQLRGDGTVPPEGAAGAPAWRWLRRPR
jgi:hypothetical protein